VGRSCGSSAGMAAAVVVAAAAAAAVERQVGARTRWECTCWACKSCLPPAAALAAAAGAEHCAGAGAGCILSSRTGS